MTAARVRLAVALLAFLGWMGYLGYAALTKDRGPVVSRSQWAASTFPVYATVSAGPDGNPSADVKVTASHSMAGPAEGTTIQVTNLKPGLSGWDGPGDYLLLLVKDGSDFRVADVPPSPGYNGGSPKVYRVTDGVAGQVGALREKI